MKPRAGYVPIDPFREALEEELARPDANRRELAHVIFDGENSGRRLTELMLSPKRKSIPMWQAKRIADALRRRDLTDDTCVHVSDTISGVGIDPCPVSGDARVKVLLERERHAIEFLKHDNTVHPELVLAMVVWPPEHLES